MSRFPFTLFLVLLALISRGARAADFEGVVQWTFQVEVTDPAMREQLAEQQRQLADPAQREELRAMIASPQMQAVMAHNPQMKTAMETQLRLAEEAAAGNGTDDLMSGLMPRGMTLRAKAGRTNLRIEGGALPMEIISREDPVEATLVDRPARTFSRIPAVAETPPDAPEQADHVVIPTGATQVILGHTCRQYLVETTQDGKKLVGSIWATADVPGLDASILARARIGGGDEDAYLNEIPGLPLQMELSTPQMRIVVEAVGLRPGSVAETVFTIPPGFTEKPFQFGPTTDK